jgi:hypothetical protein
MLILQDGLTFSQNLKHTMSRLSAHRRVDRLADAPYGQDWDVLSLGHCGYAIPPDERQRVQLWEDPEAAIMKDGRRARFMHPTFGVVCENAYAVTREGARQLLHHVGSADIERPIGQTLVYRFGDGHDLLRGYALWPGVFEPWNRGNTRVGKVEREVAGVGVGAPVKLRQYRES